MLVRAAIRLLVTAILLLRSLVATVSTVSLNLLNLLNLLHLLHLLHWLLLLLLLLLGELASDLLNTSLAECTETTGPADAASKTTSHDAGTKRSDTLSS